MTNAADIIYEYQLAADGEPVRPWFKYSQSDLDAVLNTLGIELDDDTGAYLVSRNGDKKMYSNNPSATLLYIARNDADWLEFRRARLAGEA